MLPKMPLWEKYVVDNRETCLGLHVNFFIFLFNFKQILSSSTGFSRNPPNIKCHGNPSIASRADTGGQTDRETDERT